MKKILLSIVLSALLLGMAIGQSLSLSNAEGEIPANSIVTELVDAGTGQAVTHIYVTNNNTSTLSVLVKKVENYLETDMQCSICWAGNCYPPNVFVSPNAEDLAPGETNTEGFSGDLFIDNNAVGISSVSYVFFDENNPSDSVMVIVNYIVSSTNSSFGLSNDDGPLENNGSLIVNGNPDDESLISYVHVTNNASTDKSVKVRRIETHIPGDAYSSFCWVQCYPPNVSVSPGALNMAPGDISTLFTGDYYPEGVEGNASVSYVFFDENDLSDFSTINVTYVPFAVGIEENNLNEIFLSNAYPNPASTVVSLDYDLKDVNDTKLVIYNLLGSVVRDVHITDVIGKIKVNVSDLDEGIYFYSLLVNNETVKTQKLVVKH
jgi:hypothetical protein